MTDSQLDNGTKLAHEIKKLREYRADLGRATTISLGECKSPNNHEMRPIIYGKYVADAVGASALTFVTNHKDGAPDWAVQALNVARLIMCDALDAEIARLQKQFDEL